MVDSTHGLHSHILISLLKELLCVIYIQLTIPAFVILPWNDYEMWSPGLVLWIVAMPVVTTATLLNLFCTIFTDPGSVSLNWVRPHFVCIDLMMSKISLPTKRNNPRLHPNLDFVDDAIYSNHPGLIIAVCVAGN